MTDRELMKQWIRPGAIVPVDMNTVRILLDALRERLAQPESGCAECGKSGGWALYCVACAEKLFKEPT